MDGITWFVLIVAKCNVNTFLCEIVQQYFNVLIVAKCNVNIAMNNTATLIFSY